jgi:FkbM family methyltransferase
LAPQDDRMFRHTLLASQAAAGRLLRRTPLARSTTLNRLNAELALRLFGRSEARLGPYTVRFDPRDRVIGKHLVLYGSYEPLETAAFLPLIQPGDEVLDVGANIGVYTLLMAGAVGKGRVIAVEPDPTNLELLRANVALNRCTNVTVVPCALGGETRQVGLRQDPENRGALSVTQAGRAGTVRVAMRRARDLLRELRARPRVMKVDVEGAEPDVLAGFDELPEVFMFEFTPAQLRGLGHDPLGFLRWVTGRRYALELIHPATGARIAGTAEQLLASAVELRRDVNVLALRR